MPCTKLRGYPCENQTPAFEIKIVFVCAPKMPWFWYTDGNRLGFSLGIEMDLVLCEGRKWLVFSVRVDWLGFCVGDRNWQFKCADRKWLGFVWALKSTWLLCRWSKLTWCQCRRSKLTWFQLRNRNWLGFYVRVGNDLVLVSGSKLFLWVCSSH